MLMRLNSWRLGWLEDIFGSFFAILIVLRKRDVWFVVIYPRNAMADAPHQASK